MQACPGIALSAYRKTKYNSEDVVRKLKTIFTERFGSAPYEWQLDVTEATFLGLDTVVMRGTGSGKTIPFMLPLSLNPTKMVVILSPQRRKIKSFFNKIN